jgi:hypothetical protein
MAEERGQALGVAVGGDECGVVFMLDTSKTVVELFSVLSAIPDKTSGSQQEKRPPCRAGGPQKRRRQKGASSASGVVSLAGASGSGSPWSRQRTESARIDHSVSFDALDFLALPFCS